MTSVGICASGLILSICVCVRDLAVVSHISRPPFPLLPSLRLNCDSQLVTAVEFRPSRDRPFSGGELYLPIFLIYVMQKRFFIAKNYSIENCKKLKILTCLIGIEQAHP